MMKTAECHVTNPKLSAAITLLEEAGFEVYEKPRMMGCSCLRAVARPPIKIHPLDLHEMFEEMGAGYSLSYVIHKREPSALFEIAGVFYEQDVNAPRTRSKYQ